ncbi:MAG: lysylphosphatidylglycerol synthase domain-containing protein [Leptodesmis sp.]|uniref:lysylphosphatidylglycerol synthase domain-containing protein n=1 Tax=Leptodesmis sp. TaxID=3100501 RepID=UPI003D0C2C78
MKAIASRLKPLLRWVILGACLFFLAAVLKQNWESVTTIRITEAGWACLIMALGVTLYAHIVAGWVWGWILRRDFQQLVPWAWIIQAYLQTNIAKYLPGNIWHYYGRVQAATQAGASLEAATVSVLLEPLLMAAAALLVAVFSSQAIVSQYGFLSLLLHWLILVGILLALHPKVLNLLIRKLAKAKQKATPVLKSVATPVSLNHYPWMALLGELGFLLLRGGGFLLTFQALSSFTSSQVPVLFSAFSLAWLLGLVVPGAPGGMGVFEATVISLLGREFPSGLLLGVVALYRLVSVASEALGAGLGWLDQQRDKNWHGARGTGQETFSD